MNMPLNKETQTEEQKRIQFLFKLEKAEATHVSSAPFLIDYLYALKRPKENFAHLVSHIEPIEEAEVQTFKLYLNPIGTTSKKMSKAICTVDNRGRIDVEIINELVHPTSFFKAIDAMTEVADKHKAQFEQGLIVGGDKAPVLENQAQKRDTNITYRKLQHNTL